MSTDRLTNELLAVRSAPIRITDGTLGVQFSEAQKQDLAMGKGVKVDGMTPKKGEEFAPPPSSEC